MALNYGRKARQIRISDIDSISLVNATIAENYDTSSGAIIKVDHQAVGCGSTGFTILLKDDTPWTHLTYKTYMTGGASCWNLNRGGNTGYLPSVAHNILELDVANTIDRFFAGQNCFELPQYAVKTFACDNNSDNFMHASYHTGDFKSWIQTRRRDTSASGLAGPAHGRACVWGPGHTIISDIRVW